MKYLILAAIALLLHMVLKLNWYVTVAVFVGILLFFIVQQKNSKMQKLQRQRFYDANIYMDTLLYAFLKEGKIDGALMDVTNSLPQGELKSVIEDAVDHMHMTFDDSSVIEDALGMIEEKYACSRISSIHDFMLHVEYYGGEIEKPVRILLEDKNRWESRIKRAMKEREKMFRDIVLSVITSLAICGMVLYLPVMNMDISQNLLVQILSVVVIFMDEAILLGAQKFMKADWLRMDILGEDEVYEKKMKTYLSYNPKKERRLSVALGALSGLAAVICLVFRKMWLVLLCVGVFLICANQHKIGHALAGKSLKRYLASAFPNWLMDLVLLLQSENVQVALYKSLSHVPGVLKSEVERLVDRLEAEPESAEPYHAFLASFHMPEVYSTMSMLYSLSVGNSGSAEQQVSELIVKNQELLDVAEEERMKDKNSGMYLLFLAPVVTASFKLVVDMAIFMLMFLSTSVI